MKTTIELADELARQARELAAREGTTLRALVEAGLRAQLRERAKRERFRLRDASFKGRGLRPELRGQGWERIRDLSYEGHGG